MTVVMFFSVIIFGSFFELTALDFQSWLVIIVFLMLAPSVIYVFEKGFEKAWKLMDDKVVRKVIRRRKKAA
jgi:cation-transporting ATPase E